MRQSSSKPNIILGENTTNKKLAFEINNIMVMFVKSQKQIKFQIANKCLLKRSIITLRYGQL